jgi:hypothetical protein
MNLQRVGSDGAMRMKMAGEVGNPRRLLQGGDVRTEGPKGGLGLDVATLDQ